MPAGGRASGRPDCTMNATPPTGGGLKYRVNPTVLPEAPTVPLSIAETAFGPGKPARISLATLLDEAHLT